MANPVAKTPLNATGIVSRVSKPACRPPIQRVQHFDALPIWKSALRLVWKPALRGFAHVRPSRYEMSGLAACWFIGKTPREHTRATEFSCKSAIRQFRYPAGRIVQQAAKRMASSI